MRTRLFVFLVRWIFSYWSKGMGYEYKGSVELDGVLVAWDLGIFSKEDSRGSVIAARSDKVTVTCTDSPISETLHAVSQALTLRWVCDHGTLACPVSDLFLMPAGLDNRGYLMFQFERPTKSLFKMSSCEIIEAEIDDYPETYPLETKISVYEMYWLRLVAMGAEDAEDEEDFKDSICKARNEASSYWARNRPWREEEA